jgi:hypothetical protein
MVLNCIFVSSLQTKWPLTLFPNAIDALVQPFAKMWTPDMTDSPLLKTAQQFRLVRSPLPNFLENVKYFMFAA